MQNAEASPVLKYCNIVVSQRGLAEADGKKVVLFVPAAEVDRIILKFGKAEHRPLVSLLIGLVFTLVGVFGLIELIIATRSWRFDIGLMFLGVIGLSLIFDSIKQRYFFEVHKSKGHCRLFFSKSASLSEIQNYCAKIKEAYPYEMLEEL
jgi:hypothetical protein